ncbi:hypothetical protein NIES2135_54120 [Leptolyngbya boryana NIES-2135]|jgi:hypothetical protein|uniref:Uncharacterized protein n=1 Tax=Leptolyngbya boryana NIES-2135 TaxID=1973484 RepID=A0A1Z4JP87_LEPBY|nr:MULTISPECIES: hypothetical protein [Leptolyngbya]BAY58539.1 hypothetical protein NIES2135_54120 [Leptolyngbya boryana NIES-2135]MBD2370782.1 hypothetical protein [Leptolyngbya sp. FACHB-161]MBD2377065.1 hypothetical protein [Leptolyngbya sp. FACHB-238]MBD2401508.1 hypothetical protein [Leptolyngbya sp. FACHB-239]MBD2408060.1 hypothetical protein [Leptolyngbya sp. FACHB-402]
MLHPQDFEKPTKHPFDMLRGYRNACQKESLLAWMLSQCVEAGEWIAIPCQYQHDDLVKDEILIPTEQECCYRLSKKAKGLLYSVYGKED